MVIAQRRTSMMIWTSTVVLTISFCEGVTTYIFFPKVILLLEILNLIRNISRDDNYSNLAMQTMTQDANYLIVIIWGRIFLRR
jgi:hypothetical protein